MKADITRHIQIQIQNDNRTLLEMMTPGGAYIKRQMKKYIKRISIGFKRV